MTDRELWGGSGDDADDFSDVDDELTWTREAQNRFGEDRTLGASGAMDLRAAPKSPPTTGNPRPQREDTVVVNMTVPKPAVPAAAPASNGHAPQPAVLAAASGVRDEHKEEEAQPHQQNKRRFSESSGGGGGGAQNTAAADEDAPQKKKAKKEADADADDDEPMPTPMPPAPKKKATKKKKKTATTATTKSTKKTAQKHPRRAALVIPGMGNGNGAPAVHAAASSKQKKKESTAAKKPRKRAAFVMPQDTAEEGAPKKGKARSPNVRKRAAVKLPGGDGAAPKTAKKKKKAAKPRRARLVIPEDKALTPKKTWRRTARGDGIEVDGQASSDEETPDTDDAAELAALDPELAKDIAFAAGDSESDGAGELSGDGEAELPEMAESYAEMSREDRRRARQVKAHRPRYRLDPDFEVEEEGAAGGGGPESALASASLAFEGADRSWPEDEAPAPETPPPTEAAGGLAGGIGGDVDSLFSDEIATATATASASATAAAAADWDTQRIDKQIGNVRGEWPHFASLRTRVNKQLNAHWKLSMSKMKIGDDALTQAAQAYFAMAKHMLVDHGRALDDFPQTVMDMDAVACGKLGNRIGDTLGPKGGRFLVSVLFCKDLRMRNMTLTDNAEPWSCAWSGKKLVKGDNVCMVVVTAQASASSKDLRTSFYYVESGSAAIPAILELAAHGMWKIRFAESIAKWRAKRSFGPSISGVDQMKEILKPNALAAVSEALAGYFKAWHMANTYVLPARK